MLQFLFVFIITEKIIPILRCLCCRWFEKWGVKMDSEKQQRVQKRELIGDTLEAEDLPLEHTVRKNNKNVTVLKQTACASGECHSLC